MQKPEMAFLHPFLARLEKMLITLRLAPYQEHERHFKTDQTLSRNHLTITGGVLNSSFSARKIFREAPWA